MLRLITLGGLRLERDGVAVSDRMRPRRLALLAILAASGPNGLSREAVLAILWSESSPERARHSLAQEVYALRREVNAAIIPPGATLRLDPAYVTSDIADLRAAIDQNDSAAVDALYAGPYLDGFYLSDAPDFERWVDDERASIRRDVIAALERAALEREGDNGSSSVSAEEPNHARHPSTHPRTSKRARCKRQFLPPLDVVVLPPACKQIAIGCGL